MYGNCLLARHWSQKSYGGELACMFLSNDRNFLNPAPKEFHTFSGKRNGISLHAAVDELDLMDGKVDVPTYASLLCSCVHATDLSCGKRVHGHLKKSNLAESSYLGSLVLQMYAKCGAWKEAEALFTSMQNPNVYSWSHMIGAYAAVGDSHGCWVLFDRMQWEGIAQQKVTFAHILTVCGNVAALRTGKQLHNMIIENGFHDCFKLGTALVSMYARCGSLEAAREVFDSVVDKDVVCWNAMIAAYAQQGSCDDALCVFELMQQQGVSPNRSTVISTVDACTGLMASREGKQVHAYATCAGLDSDVAVATALVNMYGKCSSLRDSQSVFDRVTAMDVMLWNTMIAACTSQGQHNTMMQLFAQMQIEGWPRDHATFVSVFNSCAGQGTLDDGKRAHVGAICLGSEQVAEVGSAIVNMYGKCNDIKGAEKVFDRLEERDLLAWTSMVTAYAQNELRKEALLVFDRMRKQHTTLDKVAFLSVLPAYASQAMLREAQLMHTTLCHIGVDVDVEVANSLITMYGKCGSLDAVHAVFGTMPERDLISWNAIIAAYAHHGLGVEVLELYGRLENARIKPDCITYMSIFLACSHSGLLDEGRRVLVSMTRAHGILPNVEHFGCLIDLLSRAGQLEEAESLLSSLESEPTYAQWLSLLGACRNRLDVERGERAATQAFKLDSSNKSPHILLSSIYALASHVDEAEEVT